MLGEGALRLPPQPLPSSPLSNSDTASKGSEIKLTFVYNHMCMCMNVRINVCVCLCMYGGVWCVHICVSTHICVCVRVHRWPLGTHGSALGWLGEETTLQGPSGEQGQDEPLQLLGDTLVPLCARQQALPRGEGYG